MIAGTLSVIGTGTAVVDLFHVGPHSVVDNWPHIGRQPGSSLVVRPDLRVLVYSMAEHGLL